MIILESLDSWVPNVSPAMFLKLCGVLFSLWCPFTADLHQFTLVKRHLHDRCINGIEIKINENSVGFLSKCFCICRTEEVHFSRNLSQIGCTHHIPPPHTSPHQHTTHHHNTHHHTAPYHTTHHHITTPHIPPILNRIMLFVIPELFLSLSNVPQTTRYSTKGGLGK